MNEIGIGEEGILMKDSDVEGELNAVRNSIAIILKNAIIMKGVPPQAQQNLLQSALREGKRINRRHTDFDDRKIFKLMLILRMIEDENW